MAYFMCTRCGVSFQRRGLRPQKYCGQACYNEVRGGKMPRPARLKELPVSVLHESLLADFETGALTRLERPKHHFLTERSWKIAKAMAGSPVAVTGTPYPKTTINYLGHTYHILAHRAVWALAYGYWPKQLDHADRNVANNSLANLREATPQQNMANRGTWNRHGLKGVTQRGPAVFQAAIKVNGKTINLGMYQTAEQAHDAYMRSAREHFGEFASC